MSERYREQQDLVDPRLGYLVAILVLISVTASIATAGIKNTVLPLALLGMLVYAGYRWLLTDVVEVNER